MAAPKPGSAAVVLVHGMGRTPASMLLLAARLRRAGLRCHLFGYVAAFEPFERIVARLARRLATLAAQRYVAVGHSLGGLLLRAAIEALPPTAPRPEHLVLLGTPARPPRAARLFAHRLLYRLLNGDCGQLLAAPERLAAVGTPPVPTTVVAGTGGPRWRWSPFGDEENDTVVAVEEVALEGASLVRLPVRHTFMMNNAAVFELIAAACDGPR